MGINGEQFPNLNPDLLGRVDQELLARLTRVLSNVKVAEVRDNTIAGIRVTGDIEKTMGVYGEPKVHVDAMIVEGASLVILTLVAGDRNYNPATATGMSKEQRLHLAFVANTFNQKLHEAFGVVVNLNNLLNNGGSFSFIYDPKEYNRKSTGGQFEDLNQ